MAHPRWNVLRLFAIVLFAFAPFLFFGSAAVAIAPPAGPATLIVNSTGDLGDSNPNDGICYTGQSVVVGQAEVNECTLRAAIEQSNATVGGSDTINFTIPANDANCTSGICTIKPASFYNIDSTNVVVIDGYCCNMGATKNTNPTTAGLNASLKIIIDGSNGAGTGFSVHSASTIRGLNIREFSVGIDILGFANTGAHVEGNYIGTDVTGALAMGNTVGVEVDQTDGHVIGGLLPEQRNLISGNFQFGIGIDNGGVEPPVGNMVLGNLIGTNASGTASIANCIWGIRIAESRGVVVGGSTTAARNVISGNGEDLQIAFPPSFQPKVLQQTTCDTFVGAALSFKAKGVSALATPTITGGGGAIQILGGSGHTIQGNYLGLDITGLSQLPIGTVQIQSRNNLFGGQTATPGTAPGNVLSAGVLDILQFEDAFQSFENTVKGNVIGPNAAGQMPAMNLGGVVILDSQRNVIGGNSTMDRNIISANVFGVAIVSSASNPSFGVAAEDNRVAGNFIGTNIAGTGALGNGIAGILILNATDNYIGGTAVVDSPNTIAYTLGSAPTNLVPVEIAPDFPPPGGVLVMSSDCAAGLQVYLELLIRGVVRNCSGPLAGVSNPILGNSIFSNAGAGLGIDLGANGVTLNDTAGHGGPNHYLEFPVLSANGGSGSSTYHSDLHPNSKFRLQFFNNTSCNAAPPNDYGEGQTLLNSVDLTTNVDGNISFSNLLFATNAPNPIITSTATLLDADNLPVETSEFSKCVAAPTQPTATPTPTTTPVIGQATTTPTPTPTSTPTVTPTPRIFVPTPIPTPHEVVGSGALSGVLGALAQRTVIPVLVSPVAVVVAPAAPIRPPNTGDGGLR